MDPTMLTNVNAKRINQTTTSSKSLEIKDEDIEVSYKEVLKEEISVISKQNRRNRSNQGKSKITNDFQNPDTINTKDAMRLSHFIESPNHFRHLSPQPSRLQKIKGDVNGDGTLDQKDVATLEKYNNGDDVKIEMKNADINEDGVIDKEDTISLQKIVNPNIGDVNGDGKVTQADVHALEQYYVGNKSDINMKNADMNGDGKISTLDIGKVQNLVNELNPDMGDANGDGIVNAKDMDLMSRALNDPDVKVNMDKADMDGNGKITLSDFSDVMHIVSKRESNFEKIIGDTNGDGVVNESDHTNLKNYIENVDSSDDFIRKNSDINNDGQIDEKDLQGLRDKLDGINVNYSEGGTVGDVNGDGKVTRADKEALKNYVNRESNGGNEFYINNADINGDGKIDKKDVAALGKQVDPKHRPHEPHHNTSEVIPTNLRPTTSPTSPLRPTGHVTNNFEERPTYEPWSNTIRQIQPVFTNSDLNSRSSGEFISIGVKINVISETDNAYKVQYPTARGEQTGWIGRNAFEKPQSIQNVLQNFVREFVGQAWSSAISGNGLNISKDFASFIFGQVNNIGDIGSIGDQSRNNNYRLNVNANFVGVRGSNQFLTKHNAKTMFRDAQVGDFVQMRRRNGESHSAILAEVSAKSVQFLEVNAEDQNGNFVYNRINLTSYSYERLAADNSSMSLYYPKHPMGEEV